jgi:hypothetical protein
LHPASHFASRIAAPEAAMTRASRSFALSFALAILLLFSGTVLASHHEEGEEKPSSGVSTQQMIEEQLGDIPTADEIITELTTELELSTEQATSIRPILIRLSKQALELVEKFQAGELHRMTLMMKITTIGNEAAKAMEPYLTPDQTKKYGQLRREQRKDMMRQFMKVQSAPQNPQ